MESSGNDAEATATPPSRDITNLITITNECIDVASETEEAALSRIEEGSGNGDLSSSSDKCSWCMAPPEFRPISPLLVVDSEEECDASTLSHEPNIGGDDDDDEDSTGMGAECFQIAKNTHIHSLRAIDATREQSVVHMDSIRQHSVRALEELKLGTQRLVGTSTEALEGARRQSMQTIETARVRSLEGIESARHHSVRTLEGLKGETQRLVGTSTEALEGARRQSMQTIETARVRSLEGIESARQQSTRAAEGFRDETLRLLGSVRESSTAALQDVHKQSRDVADESTRFLAGVRDRTVVGWGRFMEAATVTYAPYYLGTAPRFWTTDAYPCYCGYLYGSLVVAAFRGFGAVVFCDNPVTGIFIWLGMLCAAPLAGVSSLLSAVTANATALYLRMDKAHLLSGRYAKNALMVGSWIVGSLELNSDKDYSFHSSVVLLFLSAAVLAPITVLAEDYWSTKIQCLPSLLFPSNAVLIGTAICAKMWNHVRITQVEFKHLDTADADEDDAIPSPVVVVCEAIANSLSHVFVLDQHNGNAFVTGILVLIGVLFCSRIIATSLVGGAFVASVLLGGLIFDEPDSFLGVGAFGFNPALSTAAIFYFWVPSWKLAGLALMAVIATVVLQAAATVVLQILGISIPTTLGFCFTLLFLLSMDAGTAGTPGQRYNPYLERVPEAQLSTPEVHAQRRNASSDNSDSDGDTDVDIESAVSPVVNEKTPLLSTAGEATFGAGGQQDSDSLLEQISEVLFLSPHDREIGDIESPAPASPSKVSGNDYTDGNGTPLLSSEQKGTSSSDGFKEQSFAGASALLSQPSDETFGSNSVGGENSSPSKNETQDVPSMPLATSSPGEENQQATKDSETAPSTSLADSDVDYQYNGESEGSVDVGIGVEVPSSNEQTTVGDGGV